MTDKFQNKYRIPSSRLQNWDYRWNAAYFVTICTKNRHHYFGEMNLSGIDIIADIMWYEIKNHSKNIELDAFVVMPNHIHGIIIINNSNGFTNATNATNATTKKPNHGKYFPKTGIIVNHFTFVQIGGNKPRPSFGISICMAITFS
jgi:REP element-mobilizing transposase RayT